MSFSVIPLVTRQSIPVFTAGRKCALSAVFMTLLIGLSGCMAPERTLQSESITVLGEITVRGNVPFHETVLITEANNWYILDMTAELRESLLTPARARVTGMVRLGEWNGRPFTRLQVEEIVLEQ